MSYELRCSHASNGIIKGWATRRLPIGKTHQKKTRKWTISKINVFESWINHKNGTRETLQQTRSNTHTHTHSECMGLVLIDFGVECFTSFRFSATHTSNIYLTRWRAYSQFFFHFTVWLRFGFFFLTGCFNHLLMMLNCHWNKCEYGWEMCGVVL